MPTRELVTSRYSRFVSNARSVPFRVRLLFNTDPDIRPIAIQRGLLYSSINGAVLREPCYIVGQTVSVFSVKTKRATSLPPFHYLGSVDTY